MKKCLKGLFTLALLAAGVYLWYSMLPDRNKKFIDNILRQIPDMPGRYMV